MRVIQRSVAFCLALGSALFIAGGCNSLIGATKPTLVDSFDASSDAGASCLHNSDCADAEVCLFRVCSQACAADKDCPLSQRCLQATAGTACVLATSTSCSSGDICPDGSHCASGNCRTGCQGASDCLPDQLCVAGSCSGTDKGRDPDSASSSGGGAGSGGMGDSGTGGVDQTTMGGSDQGSAGLGGSGGTAGSGGAPPECTPDYVACKGLSPVSCQGGKILSAGPDCPYACKAGACVGECTTGKTQCTDLVFSQCLANTWQNTNCNSVCDAAKGCVGSCTLNSLQCNGPKELDVCTAGAYVKNLDCPVACALVGTTSKCVACGDADGLCPAGCTSPTDADCPKALGEHCTANGDCANGFCVNTVCCGTSSCSGSCYSCNVSGHEGTCTEVNGSISTDPDNCGTCGTVCSASHITRSCGGGSCAGGSCAAGFADCNANKALDGCEVNLNSDPAHCGGCSTVCSSNNISANSCNGGSCNGSCAVGFADCDGNKQTNGCELDIRSNPLHCGSCATQCKYGECVSSACAAPTYAGLTGPGQGQSDAFSGRIYFFKITFASAGKLAALGMYTTTAGSHAYLGLYSDFSGAPQNRVAMTSELTSVAGNQTEGVLTTLVPVSATSYWIALNTDAAASSALKVSCETASTSNLWFETAAYAPLPTSSPAGLGGGTLQIPDFYAVTVP